MCAATSVFPPWVEPSGPREVARTQLRYHYCLPSHGPPYLFCVCLQRLNEVHSHWCSRDLDLLHPYRVIFEEPPDALIHNDRSAATRNQKRALISEDDEECYLATVLMTLESYANAFRVLDLVPSNLNGTALEDRIPLPAVLGLGSGHLSLI